MNIELTHHRPDDHQAITIEQVIKRRVMRRRRVAKRMAARFPLMAVEFMQEEFPGYTYDQWVEDVSRKTRKGKSFRRPKKKAFDWDSIRKDIPDFFNVCRKRTKTKAVLHGKTKDGNKFTCTVRAVYWTEYGERRLDTSTLISLWRGPLKAFCEHPAMLLEEHKTQF